MGIRADFPDSFHKIYLFTYEGIAYEKEQRFSMGFDTITKSSKAAIYSIVSNFKGDWVAATFFDKRAPKIQLWNFDRRTGTFSDLTGPFFYMRFLIA